MKKCLWVWSLLFEIEHIADLSAWISLYRTLKFCKENGAIKESCGAAEMRVSLYLSWSFETLVVYRTATLKSLVMG